MFYRKVDKLAKDVHIQLNSTETTTGPSHDVAQRQVIDKFLDAIWTIAALIVVLETDKQEWLMC